METKYTKGKTEVTKDGEVKLVVFSDASEDRHGDTIDPRAWTETLKDFNKNPVLLWAHDSHLTPSVPAIGRVNGLKVNNSGQLVGSLEFDMEDEFAVKVYKKFKKGILSATSVGFKPIEFEEREKADGINFTKVELLEISACNVPANRNALTQLRSMNTKAAKTRAKLMEEYLEKHEPNKMNKEVKKKKVKKENPQLEALEQVKTEFRNAINRLDAIIQQMESNQERQIKLFIKMEAMLEKNENGGLTKDDIKHMVEMAKFADKMGEALIRSGKNVLRQNK